MKKNKSIKRRLEKIFYLILIIAILIININTLMVVFAESEEDAKNMNITKIQDNQNNIVRIADTSTVDDYKKYINNQGGRYNGRVWTDKSVYANNGEGKVTLDDKFNIQYDDDFLTVFSALGSSQSVEQSITLGLDTSIIIDVSGSMGVDVVDNLEHDDEQTRIAHSRIQATVTAVNNLIDKLMDSNEKNRICVIAYGGTSYVLMELEHYTKIEGSNEYITVEDFKYYDEKTLTKSGSSAYTLHAHAKKSNNEIIDHTVRNNYTANMPDEKEENINACIGFNTNMQAGIYAGFEELYDNVDSKVMRIPTAIIISDGGSNYALKDKGNITGDEWHNVPIVNSLENYNNSNIYKKYRTETNEMNRGGKETILDILLTASYMKVKVQKKYEEVFNKFNMSKYDNSIDFKIHTVSVDTSEMVYTDTTQWQVPRIYTTLDPKNFFKQDLSDVKWDFKQDSIDAYELWKQWKTSTENVSTVFKDSDNRQINFKVNKLKDDDEVTNEDIIQNIYYNESFRDISSGDIESSFSEIIATAVTSFNPIDSSENEAGDVDSLSYIDPIGKYMEVKEVKKLLLFGREYNIIKDGEPVVEDNDNKKISKQYYKPVNSDNKDIEIMNESYGNERKFKLSDIKIWKEVNYTNEKSDSDYDELLHVTIPSNAIPIHLDSIEIDELNNVKKYETNSSTDFALPIRIVYTVGINSQIINQDSKEIDFTKISKDYFKEKREEIEQNGKKDTYIYFLSNFYNKKIYDSENKQTSGNAGITFIPSSNNRFYIFQKNLIIYEKSSGGNDKGEGELKETGGNVQLSNPVTDLSKINPKETYYFAIDYYVPEENSDNSEGRYVQYATAHKGAEFLDEKGESYLTYYDTAKKQEVSKKGQDVVVTTKKERKE